MTTIAKTARILAGTLFGGILSAGVALAGDAAPATPQPGVWKKHTYAFHFMGFTSTYSCDGLADQLKVLLLAAGARKDDPSARSDRPGAHKQPYFIHRADGGVLAFAGIYELWRDDAAGDGDPDAWLWTAAIITTQAQDDLGQIHDRMPMVVEPGRWSEWLDPTQADEARLHALLAPAASGGLSSYPVSTEVNAVRNNGPGLIEPADRERGDASNGTAGKLF